MAHPSQTTLQPAGRRRPLAGMLVGTLALNILGLSVPLAASLVFSRILPNPGSATLTVVVLAGIVIAMTEALLRLGRASMVTHAQAGYAGTLTHKVLTHVAMSDVGRTSMTSSRSLEQLSAIQQLAERHSGQILINFVELLFLPLVVGVIFYVFWVAGVVVLGLLVVVAAITLVLAARMKRLAAEAQLGDEERYDFLFATLGALHAIKATGIEDNLVRRYEAVQARVARDNHALALAASRLLDIAPLASQALVATMLVLGAVCVGTGDLTMGGVTALVLLCGRIMGPLQRGCFIVVQLKDVDAARKKIDGVLGCPRIATNDHAEPVENAGRVTLKNVGYGTPSRPLVVEADVALEPGDVLSVSGPQDETTALLRLMAGIVAPDSGEVRLNGIAPTRYQQRLLNTCVGYVPPRGVMFRGTIRDNITRFGEVGIDEAMSVAALLEIDTLIKELPLGLDTPVGGGIGEPISPGLVKQLVLVRALAPRPRLILLDRAGRGLDKEAYSRLHRFLGSIRGQATFVIVSDDENLAGFATKRFRMVSGNLVFAAPGAGSARIAYRDLKL